MKRCEHYKGTERNPADENGSFIVCPNMPNGKVFFPFGFPDGKEQSAKCWNDGEGCIYKNPEIENDTLEIDNKTPEIENDTPETDNRKDEYEMKIQSLINDEPEQTSLDTSYRPAALEAASTELTAKQIEAVTLHRKILTDGQIAADSLVALAQDLKQMRDTKLYLELGHETFESYCNDSAKIGQRQAYNFIKALDSWGADGMAAHAGLGITKLSALATLFEDEREQLLESEDVAALSVRELQAKIDELQHKYEQQTLVLNDLTEEKEKIGDDYVALDSDYLMEKEKTEALIAQLKATEDKKLALEEKLKELETAPKDVITAISDEDKAKIRAEAAKELAEEQKKAIKEAEKKATDKAQKDITTAEAAKKTAEAAKELAEREKKAAEEKAKTLEAQISELQSIAKKAQSAPPPSEKKELIKYHFNTIQTAFNASAEIIGALEGEERKQYKAMMLKLSDSFRAEIEKL